MSARVLNPAMMMTEMSRVVVSTGSSVTTTTTTSRTTPSRAALARVRRDLFGPVDHAAARALAERELKAQSILDNERWGFDFHLEIPKMNSRFDWEVITDTDCVPEPYALRGMPYLKRSSPPTPRKYQRIHHTHHNRLHRVDGDDDALLSRTFTPIVKVPRTSIVEERTPPSSSSSSVSSVDNDRVPLIGETTPEAQERGTKEDNVKNRDQPTTPLVSRKQASITDFMKSRKRTLNGSTKSTLEPPVKVSRNAGQIRS